MKSHEKIPHEDKWKGDEGHRDPIENDPEFNRMVRESNDKHFAEHDPKFHAMMKRVQGAAK